VGSLAFSPSRLLGVASADIENVLACHASDQVALRARLHQAINRVLPGPRLLVATVRVFGVISGGHGMPPVPDRVERGGRMGGRGFVAQLLHPELMKVVREVMVHNLSRC